MKNFVFGVLTYNQESLIQETLESIKFQKINYGNNIDVSLIIVDDASRDGTVNVISKWIDNNRTYFANIIFIDNKKNKGTVYNFCTILKNIKNEDFKVIAGDDLIGCGNLFIEYDNLNSKKIKRYVMVQLKNDKIIYDEKSLIDFYYHKKHCHKRKHNLKFFRRGGYFHTPSTLFSKELFQSAKCEENLKGFRLFEDDPTWYSMIKAEPNLEIDFIEKGIVLYRIHDKAVSNSPNLEFERELLRLRKKYYRETKGLEHMYFATRVNPSIPKFLRLDLYIDKISHLKRHIVCMQDKGYKKFKAKIERQIYEEQKYYYAIKQTVSDNDVKYREEKTCK